MKTNVAKKKQSNIDALIHTLDPFAQMLFKFSKFLSIAGMICFTSMVCLTFIDVFLRYIFNSPLTGTYEITTILMAIVVFSSIAYVQWTKSHVCMDVLTASLKPNNRTVFECATIFWSILVCLLSCYATTRYAVQTKSMLAQMGIPLKPFVGFVAFGLATLVVTLCWDFLCALAKLAKLDTSKKLMAFALTTLPVLMAWWLATNKIATLSPITIGCLGIFTLFTLFLTGMPIAFALMATGFIFSSTLRGVGPAISFYGKIMFTSSANYAWSPLMFFMLMGYFCFYGDLGRDLYTCARRWLGHYRGGLAQGSVCACSAFGAVVGDNLSGSIAMSAIALPEMRKFGYDDKLAVGTLACSGTIGTLIPPSTDLILYAVLAEQSVADLFMAGAIPGAICTIIFCTTVWILVRFRPSLAPCLPKENLADRMHALTAALPILTLFILVIGGTYAGIFTPTEGGAIGAMGAFFCALGMRRLTLKKFCAALSEAGKYITMSFSVLTGAAVFGYFMALSRIPQSLAGSISEMGLSAGLAMLAIVAIMFVLGCFVPAMPLLLVCVPTFLPIAHVFQWNLVWFGIIMVILLNLATITPPFGINLFVIKEIAKIPLETMFHASLPFVIGMIILLTLVYFIPATAMWLPALLH